MILREACLKMNDFNCRKVGLRLLNDHSPEVIDLFVCAASYEERCLSIPTAIDKARIRKAIVLKNEEVLGRGSEHKDQLLALFEGKSELVTITQRTAIKTADQIIKMIDAHLNKANLKCSIDITTMTHETLLVLYRVLFEKQIPVEDVTFLYSPAKEYDPGKSPEDKWLSKGLKDVRSVLGFPGLIKPSQKTHLIVLVGFEVDRAAKLIDIYEPSTLSLGLGEKDPINEDHLGVNRQKFERLLHSHPNAQRFAFSPSDPYEVKRTLFAQIAELHNQNVIIAPMNTKISTLGVALAAQELESIQICYGPAAMYNIGNYSSSAETCYIFNL